MRKTKRQNKRATVSKAARKRKQRRRAAIFALAALVIGIVLSLTVFFKIQIIHIDGVSVYSGEEITAASGLKNGKNIFCFSAKNAEENIETLLPYIATANIKRVLPSTVEIEIESAEIFGIIEFDGRNLAVDRELKVLEVLTHDEADEYRVISGLELERAEIGFRAVFSDVRQDELYTELIEALKTYGLFEKISYMDISDRLDIKVEYDSRIMMEFGTSAELERKAMMAAEVIFNRIEVTDAGTLDLSTAGKAYFR